MVHLCYNGYNTTMNTIVTRSRVSLAKARCFVSASHRCRCQHDRHKLLFIRPITNAPSSTKAASDDAIAVDGEAAKKEGLELNAHCVRPRPIFPWRSSPIPLKRLERPAKPKLKRRSGDDDIDNTIDVENTRELEEYWNHDYFTKGGPLGPGWATPLEPWFRGVLYANCIRFLGIKWPYILIPWTRKNWEEEMQWNFCHAFTAGVNGMIENTYNSKGAEVNPNNDEGKEEEAEESDSSWINLDVTLDPLLAEKNDTVTCSTGGKHSEESNNNDKSDTKKDEGEEELNMLQRDLRQLYQSAKEHSQPSKVNILLQSVPESAQIESMFPVLGLSRGLVDDHPDLRHTYRKLYQRLQSKKEEDMSAEKTRLNPVELGRFISGELDKVLERSANLSGDDRKALITIVVQVSINCKEVFCVKDVATGTVLQGYDDGEPRDVTHLVRFEMVVKEKMIDVDSDDSASGGGWDNWEMELGRWQITDWDDLLEGNVFFA